MSPEKAVQFSQMVFSCPPTCRAISNSVVPKVRKKVDTDQMDQNNSESLFFLPNAILHHVEMKTGRQND